MEDVSRKLFIRDHIMRIVVGDAAIGRPVAGEVSSVAVVAAVPFRTDKCEMQMLSG